MSRTATQDPIIPLCKEWLALEAIAADAHEVVFKRFCEVQDTIASLKPVTLEGLMARQAVMSWIAGE